MEPIYNAQGRRTCIDLSKSLDLISRASTSYHSEVTIALKAKDNMNISCYDRSPSNTVHENNEFLKDIETTLEAQRLLEYNANILNNHFMIQHVKEHCPG